ncbi:CRISPR system precrRNA processing endoribonuclease RAMP protein Cas6 [Vibrio sp. MarTm2]|uniref:CRISPR system precrRNA processing endoribonuclease RAMP protein Cas6 n=1 Tax=Vibrio sp. MarTm2 TaxID=2998831 RepID=UPI0022CDA332|nr:CRISPR system precrRNA processing endoribonuclease RAMP protein Cas6 [Vibrio sp. MarTm2]MDA0129457.1 CRISPR system precrRNA processing endoribonuclease RAMP protein Cas6 [Vibrio sp. MarTm2]
MTQHPLIELCQHFRLLKLHITVQLERDTHLPPFKGSLLHGWFGQSLARTEPQAYFVFFGEHANQQPKPYAITPSCDHKTEWRKGEFYSFELTLFGDAVGLDRQVINALTQGAKLGWGEQKTPINIMSISSLTPVGLKAGMHITNLADWLTIPYYQANAETAIEFITPVRLKHQDRLINTFVDDAPFWLNHILRRLKQLTTFWVADDPKLINTLYLAAQVSGDWQVTSSSYYEDWQRYSAKQQSLIPFGGVQGQVQFNGDIAPLVPWLAIGEQLQIGGKSTFGLGKYRLILPD